MQNLWTTDVPSGKSPIDDLVSMSRLIGADPNLVVWGGGNTSVKTVETDFRGRETRVLRIKGSGSDMKTIEPKHFAGVRLEDILPLEAWEDMTDEAMVDYLACCLMDPKDPRPSIETLLHGFIPAAAVAHSHADAILSLVNNVNGERHVAECFGDLAVAVPYRRPGFLLSKEVGAAVKSNPEARAVILMNHGLITWGESCKEAYDRHIEMATKAAEYVASPPVSALPIHLPDSSPSGSSSHLPDGREGKEGHDSQLPLAEGRAAGQTPEPSRSGKAAEGRLGAAAMAPILRGLLTSPDPDNPHSLPDRREGGAMRRMGIVLRYDSSDDILDFLSDPGAQRLTRIGAATPDHILSTKVRPLFVPAGESDDIQTIAASLKTALADWRSGYRAYYERNKAAINAPMLEASPRVVLIPGVGMFTTGKDLKAAQVPADIYHHTIKITEGAETLGGYQTLAEPDAALAEYWPLELYKLTLAPPEAELSRKIALVTGAGGGIGKAVAELLAASGAHVAVCDIDEIGAKKVSGGIVSKYGVNRAVGLKMDVTSEADVSSAFEQCSLAFGGLDIVVSNAGIAPTGRIEELPLATWQKSLDVNATGHFLVAREAVKILRRQGLGGSIVFNVTKNVPAPGADFGAYSCAKAAEAQLCRILAVENGKFGIRCNMVNPDAVFEAGLWSKELKAERAKAQGIDESEVEDFYRKRCLLQRPVHAEDVAEAVLFFASDRRSAKTTGAVLPVDGGLREAFPR